VQPAALSARQHDTQQQQQHAPRGQQGRVQGVPAKPQAAHASHTTNSRRDQQKAQNKSTHSPSQPGCVAGGGVPGHATTSDTATRAVTPMPPHMEGACYAAHKKWSGLHLPATCAGQNVRWGCLRGLFSELPSGCVQQAGRSLLALRFGHVASSGTGWTPPHVPGRRHAELGPSWRVQGGVTGRLRSRGAAALSATQCCANTSCGAAPTAHGWRVVCW
jgi:hypothetical protein